VLPKYSFSDAKLCFWCLVSEKNTCVGIPKGINRGPLKIYESQIDRFKMIISINISNKGKSLTSPRNESRNIEKIQKENQLIE
jgi:hypothetical protein